LGANQFKLRATKQRLTLPTTITVHALNALQSDVPLEIDSKWWLVAFKGTQTTPQKVSWLDLLFRLQSKF